jgi:pilus assembly protein CpaE
MMNQTAQTNAAPLGGDQSLVALVPRINIHVFCDNQQTAETMQMAAADRRMARAHTTIQLGGIMAAVQVY